ncbi:MAG: DUF1801 domain-containing protein [Saccharospirillaceae bacterium]|nr:hypothetical protein [Pseudomonadales bacterium]NRB81236.1 DUF1801 domain-containing protein [Saccharospirillaceae bacterium]
MINQNEKPNAVQDKWDSYPRPIQLIMDTIRQQVFKAANDLNIQSIKETLKWGEPSYLCKTGSTIRIDFKTKTPNKCYVFFNCKSKLVETIKEVYSKTDNLEFDGNRALIMDINQPIDLDVLRHCFVLALNYHNIKNLPLLGV